MDLNKETALPTCRHERERHHLLWIAGLRRNSRSLNRRIGYSPLPKRNGSRLLPGSAGDTMGLTYVVRELVAAGYEMKLADLALIRPYGRATANAAATMYSTGTKLRRRWKTSCHSASGLEPVMHFTGVARLPQLSIVDRP